MSLIILICFVLVNNSWADNGNFTFTYDMASKCKEHICRRGYTYDTFYQIDEDNLKHATVKIENSVISYFEMHIALQAPSNGHILLSSTQRPGLKDPVYEIVIGGGGNKFTELRLNQKTNARASAKTPGILSSIDFTAFYIRISDDGLIEFGKEGDSKPVLRFYDARTIPIKYFSFASWTGVEAKFLYDCPDPNSSDAKTPNSQVVAPKMSTSDELKRSLLLSKLPSIPPRQTMMVQLGIRVTHVKYNAMDSTLTTRVAVVMSWIDDNLAWNPSKYNGTTSLKFRQGRIWRPMFFVFNSGGIDPLDTENPDLITVLHSGQATFHFQTEITTWCSNNVDEINNWPHDKYSCAIVIEPWEVHEKIVIEIMKPDDEKLDVFADIDTVIPSEWEISYNEMVVKPHIWNTMYTHVDNDTHQSDRFVIEMYLTRSATSYNIVFYTPFLVLLTFVLMSFWCEPLDMSRVWFYTGCTIIICICLDSISFLVPNHTTPSILILYITILYGVLLALLVHVMLMTTMAEKMCKTVFIQSIITSSLVRTVFCLPPIKISLNGEYARQEDDGESSMMEGSVEEMDSERTRGVRFELAEVLDKVLFFVYSGVAAGLMAAHF